MLQCIFYSSVFNDLILYKQAFLLQKEQKAELDMETNKIGKKISAVDSDQNSVSKIINNSV